MEILSSSSWTNSLIQQCKVLNDQCLMLVFKFPIMIFIFTYFICHVCHKIWCHKICCPLPWYIEKSYQPSLSPSIESSSSAFISKLYRELSRVNSIYTYFLKKGLWCYIRHAILNSYFNHMKDARFYTLDTFFFLRILFDIFNASFYFCYLKSKV